MSRHRAFCFTFNNYQEDDIEKLKALPYRYIIMGFEEAPTTGTPHIQGYIYFQNAKTLSAVKKAIPCHVAICKGTPEQNHVYCTKAGEFYEDGDRPSDDEARGQDEKKRWDDARLCAKEGRYEDIPSDIYIRYQSSFKRIRREDQPKPVDLEPAPTYGIWIWGPPRTGKSHKARHDYGDVYLKDINKWWDDYQGQDNVLIDEFSPESAVHMTHFMKKWVDRWTFSAECKGGRILARPKKIIVTSNYSIQECFPNPVDLAALESRFEVIHLDQTFII